MLVAQGTVYMQASWGGGGKGIRKAGSDEDVQLLYKQVCTCMRPMHQNTMSQNSSAYSMAQWGALQTESPDAAGWSLKSMHRWGCHLWIVFV